MARQITVVSSISLAVLGAVAMIGWWYADRPSIARVICEAGLPNLTRPNDLAKDELGCTPLSERREISGLALSLSAFRSNVFEPYKGEKELLGGYSAWLVCLPGRCVDRLKKLDSILPRECGLRPDGVPWSWVRVEGWVTLEDGQYGDLGLFRRKFYVDRIVEISSPPIEILRERESQLKEVGLC